MARAKAVQNVGDHQFVCDLRSDSLGAVQSVGNAIAHLTDAAFCMESTERPPPS
jgi:hypothetical protein